MALSCWRPSLEMARVPRRICSGSRGSRSIKRSGPSSALHRRRARNPRRSPPLPAQPERRKTYWRRRESVCTPDRRKGSPVQRLRRSRVPWLLASSGLKTCRQCRPLPHLRSRARRFRPSGSRPPMRPFARRRLRSLPVGRRQFRSCHVRETMPVSACLRRRERPRPRRPRFRSRHRSVRSLSARDQ